ncbi:MAG: phospho-N-acetylmuramoyl-pentapeptide-transferase [Bacilli bacterium]|nr:phospho-N-acetylmuramoyl-pentapeptide-transferase [Bacilli bacterium]
MIAKSVMALLIGFCFSMIFGIIIIPLLKRIKADQTISIYLNKEHRNKEGTPTLGGIIFILPTIVIMMILLLTNKIHFSYTLVIIIFTLISYFLIGFVDDLIIIKKHNNVGLTISSKLIMQFIVAIIFFYLFMKGGNEPLLWIHTIHFKLNIGFLYGLFILFLLVASSNAVNITDGLDGLAAGLSIIGFITFGIISWNTGWLDGYEDIAVMAFILSGCLLGFLVFNINPAKVFMGDTGSLALGATLGAYAIMTRHELLLALIGLVFVIETISCIVQIVYFRLTNKRLFPMTPIHHTFEKNGMRENEIVRLFWLIGLICSFISLIYGVIL